MPFYSGIPLLSGIVSGAENGGLGTNQASSTNVDTFQTIDTTIRRLPLNAGDHDHGFAKVLCLAKIMICRVISQIDV
jgi:hypothetical protein